MLKRLLLMFLLCAPAAAWAFYKPVRVLAPQFVSGVNCVSGVICTDDMSRYQEAAALYTEAREFVDATVDSIGDNPRVVFCATDACFQAFGFNKAAARTVGVSGIVVSPSGWSKYYLRHEMIHHLQAERLGVVRQWRSPHWFKEGMAYSFSEDPRTVLSEPFQQYRIRFDDWIRSVGKENLWEEAAQL